jgi:hypothetical protein
LIVSSVGSLTGSSSDRFFSIVTLIVEPVSALSVNWKEGKLRVPDRARTKPVIDFAEEGGIRIVQVFQTLEVVNILIYSFGKMLEH